MEITEVGDKLVSETAETQKTEIIFFEATLNAGIIREAQASTLVPTW